MEENYTKKGGYGKRPLWQWILLYIVIAAVAYGLVYYFFFAKKGGYSYNPPQNQSASNSQNNTAPAGKTLDLSGQEITKIPDYVFSQTNLEQLNVSNNSLTGAIQSQIGQLKNLKTLNLSGNQYSEQDLSGIRAKLPPTVSIIL